MADNLFERTRTIDCRRTSKSIVIMGFVLDEATVAVFGFLDVPFLRAGVLTSSNIALA